MVYQILGPRGGVFEHALYESTTRACKGSRQASYVAMMAAEGVAESASTSGK